MKTIIMRKIFFWVIGFCCLLQPVWAQSLAPEQLLTMLESYEQVTIIDIRHTARYKEAHIQGAINIPSAVIAGKRLPPFGKVVVCGDGIRTDQTVDAVSALNAREGIEADMLEGGFAAWEALNLPTTRKSGLGRKRLHYLSYQELERAARVNKNIILVDLRTGSTQNQRSYVSSQSENGPAAEAVPTNLNTRYPELSTIKLSTNQRAGSGASDVSLQQLQKRSGAHHLYLYVLIDDGDGCSETVAGRMAAAGIRRVAVLTGGERTLERQGQPGHRTY